MRQHLGGQSDRLERDQHRTFGSSLGTHHSHGEPERESWDGEQWYGFYSELVLDECAELHGLGRVVRE